MRESRPDSVPMPSGVVAEANLLIEHWTDIPELANFAIKNTHVIPEETGFSPGFELPELDHQVREFLAPAKARWIGIGEYAGRRLTLLDLANNPATHTTKTFASLLIVARAIKFTRRHSRGVFLVSPTSGNKGTALRDAVLRAYDAGLATPETLRVAVIAPHCSNEKLRSSRLSSDRNLRRLNPLLLHVSQASENVKDLVRLLAKQHAGDIFRRTGLLPWFSLDLDNYLLADAARALFEHDVSEAHARRTHAHAVSSAFGLIGYHEGRRWLEANRSADVGDRPSSLLVQHLATPDMILYLLQRSFDRDAIPAYEPHSGHWRQYESPHFPRLTDAIDEVIDRTFYTHRPATAARMTELIDRHGGSGVVVSRRECEDHYQLIRTLMGSTGRDFPSNSTHLREWSLVMALTGTFHALDRGLLPETSEVVVHGSGWYSETDFSVPDTQEARVLAEDDPVGSILEAISG